MDDHAEFASVIIRAMTALLAFELRKAAINVAQYPRVRAAQALNDCAKGYGRRGARTDGALRGDGCRTGREPALMTGRPPHPVTARGYTTRLRSRTSLTVRNPS